MKKRATELSPLKERLDVREVGRRLLAPNALGQLSDGDRDSYLEAFNNKLLELSDLQEVDTVNYNLYGEEDFVVQRISPVGRRADNLCMSHGLDAIVVKAGNICIECSLVGGSSQVKIYEIDKEKQKTELLFMLTSGPNNFLGYNGYIELPAFFVLPFLFEISPYEEHVNNNNSYSQLLLNAAMTMKNFLYDSIKNGGNFDRVAFEQIRDQFDMVRREEHRHHPEYLARYNGSDSNLEQLAEELISEWSQEGSMAAKLPQEDVVLAFRIYEGKAISAVDIAHLIKLHCMENEKFQKRFSNFISSKSHNMHEWARSMFIATSELGPPMDHSSFVKNNHEENNFRKYARKVTDSIVKAIHLVKVESLKNDISDKLNQIKNDRYSFYRKEAKTHKIFVLNKVIEYLDGNIELDALVTHCSEKKLFAKSIKYCCETRNLVERAIELKEGGNTKQAKIAKQDIYNNLDRTLKHFRGTPKH